MNANRPGWAKNFFLCLAVLSVLALALGCAVRKAPQAPPAEEQYEEPVLGENGEEITPEELFDMKRLGKHYRPLTPQEQAALESPTEMDFQLDNEDNAEIQRYFELFTQEKRELFAKWLRRAQIYLPYVRDVLDQYKLPHDLAILPFIESGYNPRAISRAKAGGMWQFIVGTSSRYGLVTDSWVDQRFDPYLSTHSAARYLKDLYAMFGDWYLALAAYNAGEAKIAKALEQTGAGDFNALVEKNHQLGRRAKLRQETKSYVPQFLAAIKIVRNLEALGFEPLNWNAAPPLAEVEVPKGTDLMALAKSCDMNWEQFSSYNPAFLRMTSSPIAPGVAHIPPEYKDAAIAYLESPQAKAAPEFRTWKVRRGDTLKTVARKFGVSPSSIQKANHLRSSKLTPGHELLIPSKGSSKSVPPAWAEADEDQPKSKGSSKSSAKDHDSKQAKASKSSRKAKEPTSYAIQEGDTLYSLSRKSGVPVETLLAENHLKPDARLKIGQKIVLPNQEASEPEPVAVKAKSRTAKDSKAAAKASPKSRTASENKKTQDSKAAKPASGETAAKASKPASAEASPRTAPAPSVKDSKKSKSGKRYEVRKGDTLYAISRKYGVTPEAIKQANGIKSRDIQPGETLKIPQR